MKPGSGPLQEEAVIARLRSRLADTEELHFDFERANFFSFRTPVEVEIYSDSLEELHDAAAQVAAALADVPGPRRSAVLGRDGQPRGPGPFRPRATRPPRSRSRHRGPDRAHQGPGRGRDPLHRGRPRDRHPRPRPQSGRRQGRGHPRPHHRPRRRPSDLSQVRGAHRTHRRPHRDPPHRPETGRRGRRQPLRPRHGGGRRGRSGQAQDPGPAHGRHRGPERPGGGAAGELPLAGPGHGSGHLPGLPGHGLPVRVLPPPLRHHLHPAAGRHRRHPGAGHHRPHHQRGGDHRRGHAGRDRGQQRHRPHRRGQPTATRRGPAERGAHRRRSDPAAADPDDLGDDHLRSHAHGPRARRGRRAAGAAGGHRHRRSRRGHRPDPHRDPRGLLAPRRRQGHGRPPRNPTEAAGGPFRLMQVAVERVQTTQDKGSAV